MLLLFFIFKFYKNSIVSIPKIRNSCMLLYCVCIYINLTIKKKKKNNNNNNNKKRREWMKWTNEKSNYIFK